MKLNVYQDENGEIHLCIGDPPINSLWKQIGHTFLSVNEFAAFPQTLTEQKEEAS